VQVIPPKRILHFTVDEFFALFRGQTRISVDEWQMYTLYEGYVFISWKKKKKKNTR
jgi:hypothetical protein